MSDSDGCIDYLKGSDYALRNRIYAEMRRQGLRSGYLWRFQQYHGVFAVRLNEEERAQFYNTLDKFCQEGILKAIPNGTIYHYRLTEAGEQIVWK